jgi:hypothetical protein
MPSRFSTGIREAGGLNRGRNESKDKAMNQEPTIEEKLAADIDQLPWSALVRHFAFGRVYVVRKPFKLLDAAVIVHRDNANELKKSMAQDEFGIPSTDEATVWHKNNQTFDVLVVSPFVLIQSID